MLIVGIDPGAKGSVCVLDSASMQAEFMDLSTPLDQIFVWLNQKNVEAIWIEDVHSLYGMSAKSNFSFGKALGAVETLAQILCGGNILMSLQKVRTLRKKSRRFARSFTPRQMYLAKEVDCMMAGLTH
jgi:hypothetical protein